MMATELMVRVITYSATFAERTSDKNYLRVKRGSSRQNLPQGAKVWFLNESNSRMELGTISTMFNPVWNGADFVYTINHKKGRSMSLGKSIKPICAEQRWSQ